MITAKTIAALIGAQIEGDADIAITHPAKIEEAGPGAICFLGNERYEAHAYSCEASALLVSLDFQPRQALKVPTLLRVPDVYAALSVLLKHFQGQETKPSLAGVAEQAWVSPQAQLAEDVVIGPFAYIGPGVVLGAGVVVHPHTWLEAEVEVGERSIIYAGARIYKGTKIGRHCIIQANAVIGAEGFGFAPQPDGRFEKVPQLGIVELEDHVEIGANTCVDRATMGKTLIQRGVKLDNLIQIGHNVLIEPNTVMAAQSGVAGSARIGSGCMIGGQAGIAGHLQLAPGTKIQAQSGIARHIKTPNTAVYGSPALPYNDYLRAYSLFSRLPDLDKRLRALEDKLNP